MLNSNYLSMKAKLFFTSLILGATLLVSCYDSPSELELQDYLTIMRPYYPYSMEDTFIFVNDSTGSRWEGYPYDYQEKNIYPYTETYKSSNYSAQAMTSAEIHAKDAPYKWKISTNISCLAGEYHMYWYIEFNFNDSVSYQGGYQLCSSESAILASFTDTILLPIPYQHDPRTPMVEPSEPYVRIVKNKGLTDFSVDGQTVWRRVN